MLERLKGMLREQLGLSPAFVLLVAGLCAHLALNAAVRKPPFAATGLLAPLLLGLTLEAYEIWHRYRDSGLFAPGNDPLLEILGRHAIDVLLMLAIPLLVVAGGRLLR